MSEDLGNDIRELIQYAAGRSASDDATERLEKLTDSDDEAVSAWAVVMLRLRAASYVLEFEADMLRRLIDSGDMVAALDCLDFTGALVAGFESGADVVIADFLPEYLP